MLQATFRADADAIRTLTDSFNARLVLRSSDRLEFVPGHPECGVAGEPNLVMRFIGSVAEFGSTSLVSVAKAIPKVEYSTEGKRLISTRHMEFEIDPSDNDMLHVRLIVCALPTEFWPLEVTYRGRAYAFHRRSVTPDHYYGASLYRVATA